jgi:hypothetical protein
VVILSSQLNSACVIHCIVRCKGVIFLSSAYIYSGFVYWFIGDYNSIPSSF